MRRDGILLKGLRRLCGDDLRKRVRAAAGWAMGRTRTDLSGRIPPAPPGREHLQSLLRGGVFPHIERTQPQAEWPAAPAWTLAILAPAAQTGALRLTLEAAVPLAAEAAEIELWFPPDAEVDPAGASRQTAQVRPTALRSGKPARLLQCHLEEGAPNDLLLLWAGCLPAPGAEATLRKAALGDPAAGLVCAVSNRAEEFWVRPNPGEDVRDMASAAQDPDQAAPLDACFPGSSCLYLKCSMLAAMDKALLRSYLDWAFLTADLAHSAQALGGRSVIAPAAYVHRPAFAPAAPASDARLFAQAWGSGMRELRPDGIRRMHARRRPPHWLTAEETYWHYQGHARELRREASLPEEAAAFGKSLREGLKHKPPLDRPLRITVVLNVLSRTGGVLSACMLANDLIRLGVKAQLAVRSADGYCPDIPLLTEPVFFANGRSLVEHFPPCDVAVATHWTTMYYVAKAFLRHSGFLPAYFVQDYEPRFLEEDAEGRAMAERTYRMTPYCFAKSQWIGGQVEAVGGTVAQVPPALDLDLFHPAACEGEAPLRVLTMLRPGTPRRGFDTATAVLRRLEDSHPAVELHSFGCPPEELTEKDVPGTHHGELPNEALPALYQQASLFLECSAFHGFGRTAAEALACGVPVVATRSGGVEEFVRNEKNGLLADVGDADALHGHCAKLLDDAALRARLAQAARPSVAPFERLESARATLALFEQWLAAQTLEQQA